MQKPTIYHFIPDFTTIKHRHNIDLLITNSKHFHEQLSVCVLQFIIILLIFILQKDDLFYILKVILDEDDAHLGYALSKLPLYIMFSLYIILLSTLYFSIFYRKTISFNNTTERGTF